MNSVTLTYIAAERTCTYSKHIWRDHYPASLLARRSDLQKTQLPLLLRVGLCLQSCCLAINIIRAERQDKILTRRMIIITTTLAIVMNVVMGKQSLAKFHL
jgi:hypothetical protein